MTHVTHQAANTHTHTQVSINTQRTSDGNCLSTTKRRWIQLEADKVERVRVAVRTVVYYMAYLCVQSFAS